MVRRFSGLFLAIWVGLSGASHAQEDAADRALAAAQQLDEFMGTLETYAEGFPDLVESLEANLITAEEADARIDDMIVQLEEVTENMDAGKAVDTAIDDYRDVLSELIAEGKSSDIEQIRNAVPRLEDALDVLDQSDEDRANAVAEARNLIAALSENREVLSYMIRARMAIAGAEIIATRVDEFDAIIARGKQVARGLQEAVPSANP